MNSVFKTALPLLALCCAACPSEPDTVASLPDIGLDYVPATPDTNSALSAPEPMAGSTAAEYFRSHNLTVGWNIGNTLDAHSGGVSGETKWGNPLINQALLDGVKAAGFNVVRVPITWMGHFGPRQDYHIEENFLKRVARVVEMAHAAGLTVIINLHHDGSTESSGKDNGWLSINKARASGAGYQEVTGAFARVWTQIAVYFKNHGDYLIFESMNEIHDGSWGWNMSDEARQFEIINQWNQLFVDAVRTTGGNNEQRLLVVPGYCTVPKHTLASYFKLPEDAANAGNNRLIVTFHYYDPYEFGIAGTRQNWGSPQDKQAVDSVFGGMKQRFIDNGIPVIIGESGAVYQQGNEATRIAYLGYVYGKAHALGLVPIYWDNGSFSGGGEKFGLFNRTTGQPNSSESSAVIQAMVNAAR
jgi:endoglucanase